MLMRDEEPVSQLTGNNVSVINVVARPAVGVLARRGTVSRHS